MQNVHRYRELLDAGWTPQRVRTAVARGRLVRARPGYYVFAPAPAGGMLEAVLRAHPEAAGSHGTAAAVQRLRDPQPLVEVTVPHGSSLRPERGLRVHRTDRPVPTTVVRGCRVTSPARTVVDLARRLSYVEGTVVADRALDLALTTLPELAGEVAASAHRGGIGVARAAVEAARLGAQSPTETRVRLGLVGAGLPEPVLQQAVTTLRCTYHLDLAWPIVRVGVDYDGRAAHGGDLAGARDRQRWRDLRAAGWEVHPVTAHDLRALAALADELRVALARRAA